jgi:acyl-coenzyme A thioesterase PaaI-like protein
MKEESLPSVSEENMLELNKKEHQRCFTHVSKENGGLGLVFHVEPNGDVRSEWECVEGLESYNGILHGGIQAALMDSAMVQALFARGIVGRTGEMTIRYHVSVVPTKPVTITARLVMAHSPLFKLEAEIHQDGLLCAVAKAKFMSKF